MFNDFRRQKVWNHSRYLLLLVFKFTERISDRAHLNLIKEIQKSCLEIMINIEKMFTNEHFNEYRVYLNRSLSALKKLEKRLSIIRKLQLLGKADSEQLIKLTKKVIQLMNSMERKLNRRRKIIVNISTSKI